MKLSGRQIAIILLILFIVISLTSLILEELIPYLNSGQIAKFRATVLGAPIMIFSACVMVYGCIILISDIIKKYNKESMIFTGVKLQKTAPEAARKNTKKEYFSSFFKLMSPGVLIIFLAVALLILGSQILYYHDS